MDGERDSPLLPTTFAESGGTPPEFTFDPRPRPTQTPQRICYTGNMVIFGGIPSLAAVLFLARAGFAAAETTGAVTGTVVDETGGVLPGVVVNLQTGGAEFTSVTDDTGKWRIDGVPSGPAALTFRRTNFAGARREVTLSRGEVLTVDLVLVVSLTAEVLVTARPTLRNIADLPEPDEVLETVPGLVISQHSGEGKAKQYYLRGFHQDHGTDFATTVAGVPINVPSGAYASAYSDSNLILPELVSGVRFRKGPYFAEDVDFSAAGSGNVSYVSVLEQPVAKITIGGQGWSRFFGAASPHLGDGNLLIGVEAGRNDGPWVEPENLRKVNGIVRYSRGDTRNGFSIIGLSNSAKWRARDQAPVRDIRSDRIDRFAGIDRFGGGRTYRHGIVADSLRSNGVASTRITAFGMRYGFNLIQNFTYFLPNPVDGDQFEHVDRRTSTGVRLTHRRFRQFLGRPIEWKAGTRLHHDDANVLGLYDTVRQRSTNRVREDALRQTSLGVFGEGVLDWTSFFRTSVGIRADVYRFAVDAGNPLNSGAGVDSVLSPKLAAILGPWRQTEFYANWGEGFHRIDMRCASIRVDLCPGDPVERFRPLVKARGGEIGARTVRLRGLQSTVALWYRDFDSELLFPGDAGVTAANRPTYRYGIEWVNHVRLTPWMRAEANLAFTSARFSDGAPAGPRIPGSLNRVFSGVLTIEPVKRLFGSVRVRHFGLRPLIGDTPARSDSTTVWNGHFGIRFNRRVTFLFEVFNLLNSQFSGIDYFYASRLWGESLEGVNDVHTHPFIPRSARVGLQMRF